MTIIHKKGDLFTTDAKMIGHGINCHGAMRAGIAKEFSSRWPDMYAWYKEECSARRINPGHAYLWGTPEGLTIANISSQWRPGRDARYDWTVKGIGEALDVADYLGLDKIAIPLIACGIGGLNWDVLEVKLRKAYDDHNVDIEVWSL